MFARTLTSWGRLFGLSRTSAATEERRQWARVPCDIQTICHAALEASAVHLAGRVRNISRGGIAVVVAQPFKPGDLLSVTLPGGEQPCEVLACVVRCDPAEGGEWALGCTFSTQLTDDDLARFGARRQRAAPPDKRVWVRFECHARARFQVVRAADPIGNRHAQLVNISAGGVALQVSDPLNVGELLSVELCRDQTPVVISLASVVRTTLLADGDRVIGCNFIRELPEEQIEALLS